MSYKADVSSVSPSSFTLTYGCELDITVLGLRQENLHQVFKKWQSGNLWKIKKMEREEKRVPLFPRNEQKSVHFHIPSDQLFDCAM